MAATTKPPVIALADYCRHWNDMSGNDMSGNDASGNDMSGNDASGDDKPLYLIFGMLNSKDPEPFLAPLKSCAQNLYAIAIPNVQASLGAAEVQATAQQIGFSAIAVPSVRAAIDENTSERYKTVTHFDLWVVVFSRRRAERE